MKKILVIEDDMNIRESLAELLETRSYKIFSADNGHSAISLIQHEQPDLIICDVMMPGMSGYEVLESIRKNAVTASVPFVFLSAKVMEADRERGLSLGANSYLTKPFRSHELFEIVDRLLGKSGKGNSGGEQILHDFISDINLIRKLLGWRLSLS